MTGPQERMGQGADAPGQIVTGHQTPTVSNVTRELAARFDSLAAAKRAEAGADLQRVPFGVGLSGLTWDKRQGIAALFGEQLTVRSDGLKETVTTPAGHKIDFFMALGEVIPHSVNVRIRGSDKSYSTVAFRDEDAAVILDEGSVTFIERERHQPGEESSYVAMTLIPKEYSYVDGTEREIVEIMANYAEPQRSLAKGIAIITEGDTSS